MSMAGTSAPTRRQRAMAFDAALRPAKREQPKNSFSQHRWAVGRYLQRIARGARS